jgi:hypothetical protein
MRQLRLLKKQYTCVAYLRCQTSRLHRGSFLGTTSRLSKRLLTALTKAVLNTLACRHIFFGGSGGGVVAGRSASSTSTCRVPKASLMHSVKIDISPLSTSFNSNAHNYESATYQFSTQLFWISDISPGLVIFSL